MTSNNITITTASNKITVTDNQGKSRLLTATPIGIQGAQGNTGLNGQFGGPTGNTGPTGISISGAYLSNYNLILTFSDGFTVNAGYVRGETGPTGVGLCGGALETLNPSPAGYYPYASIFIDQYGRVTGASGATDIASQTSLIQLQSGISYINERITQLRLDFETGIYGGDW